MANRKNIPAVSIILPMYNMEKYIGDCLDSILAQTFDDYEVIIVDDCSTDNSCAVVGSYMNKFNAGNYDKLTLIRSKTNSGGHVGIPRNVGIGISHGEYLYFMDSDDAIVDNTLEILYKFAAKNQADVVHCDKCYRAPDDTVTLDKNNLKEVVRTEDIVTKPSMLSDRLEDRVRRFMERKIAWEPWNHLVRREFLIVNDIKFSNLSIADDMLFSFMIMCAAGKFIILPNAFYIWRVREDSNSREELPTDKLIARVGGDIFRNVQILDKFVDKFDFFVRNPAQKYALFDFFSRMGCHRVLSAYNNTPVIELYNLLKKELTSLGDISAVAAYLFNRMSLLNITNLQLRTTIKKQQEQIRQLQAQTTTTSN